MELGELKQDFITTYPTLESGKSAFYTHLDTGKIKGLVGEQLTNFVKSKLDEYAESKATTKGGKIARFGAKIVSFFAPLIQIKKK
jgi:hypothetical protein